MTVARYLPNFLFYTFLCQTIILCKLIDQSYMRRCKRRFSCELQAASIAAYQLHFCILWGHASSGVRSCVHTSAPHIFFIILLTVA